jgi:heme exporter protein D
MNLGPHADFIIGAYAAAAVVIVAMIAWVILDHRRQQRLLSKLELGGRTRRSARESEKKVST